MATQVLTKAEPQLLDVVVIDDEETFTEGCRQTLEVGGYRSAVARNGAQGLRLVHSRHPKVVLVDLKMPGMNGTEVLRELSQSEPTTVPIVVTGHGTVDSAVESMKIGAFDFLTKPFDPERLLESVRRGVSLSVLRKEPVEAAPPTADKNNVLLEGLNVLGEAYSLGLNKGQLLEELSYLEAEARYHAESLGQIKKQERAILDMRDELLDVDAIMEKYDFQKSALIQVLLNVQEKFNWVPRHVMHWISARLNVPAKEVLAIVNFYEAFSLEPRGKHRVQVCTGTACHVKGASELLTQVSSVLGIAPGKTDAALKFTLETVHCLGCCALAPVVQVDKQYLHKPSRKRLENIVKSLGKEEEAACRS